VVRFQGVRTTIAVRMRAILTAQRSHAAWLVHIESN
jgi:hypothetical protein